MFTRRKSSILEETPDSEDEASDRGVYPGASDGTGPGEVADDPNIVRFTDGNGQRIMYKLKKGRVKVTLNGKKKGIVKSFEWDGGQHTLQDGHCLIYLSDQAGEQKILPPLAIISIEAGIPGLEAFYPGSDLNQSAPGREWEVVTIKGLYVRASCTKNSKTVGAVEYGTTVVEQTVKEIKGNLWVLHSKGWSLAQSSDNKTFLKPKRMQEEDLAVSMAALAVSKAVDAQSSDRKAKKKKKKKTVSRFDVSLSPPRRGGGKRSKKARKAAKRLLSMHRTLDRNFKFNFDCPPPEAGPAGFDVAAAGTTSRSGDVDGISSPTKRTPQRRRSAFERRGSTNSLLEAKRTRPRRKSAGANLGVVNQGATTGASDDIFGRLARKRSLSTKISNPGSSGAATVDSTRTSSASITQAATSGKALEAPTPQIIVLSSDDESESKNKSQTAISPEVTNIVNSIPSPKNRRKSTNEILSMIDRENERKRQAQLVAMRQAALMQRQQQQQQLLYAQQMAEYQARVQAMALAQQQQQQQSEAARQARVAAPSNPFEQLEVRQKQQTESQTKTPFD